MGARPLPVALAGQPLAGRGVLASWTMAVTTAAIYHMTRTAGVTWVQGGALASGAVFVFLPAYVTQIGLSRIGPFDVAYSAAATGIRLACGKLSDRRRVILPALLLVAAGTLGLIWLDSTAGLLVVGALTGTAAKAAGVTMGVPSYDVSVSRS